MSRKVTVYLNGATEYTVTLSDLEITVAATGPTGNEHGPSYKVSESGPDSTTVWERPEDPEPLPAYDAENANDEDFG